MVGTMKILDALSKRPMRYSEIVEVVGLSTNATRSLKALKSLNLIRRRVINGPYRPVEYSLTDSGIEVHRLLEAIRRAVERN